MKSPTNCNVCGSEKTQKYVFRLCPRCLSKFETSANSRGFTLMLPPAAGESTDRTINGVRFWHWRDCWRAVRKDTLL